MALTAIVEHIMKVCDRKECGFFPDVNSESIVCFGCRHYRNEDFSMLISEQDTALTESLVFTGNEDQTSYSGDGIEARAGDTIKVSRSKKAQLLDDFPKWFKTVEEFEKIESAEKKPEEKKLDIPEAKEPEVAQVSEMLKKKDKKKKKE